MGFFFLKGEIFKGELYFLLGLFPAVIYLSDCDNIIDGILIGIAIILIIYLTCIPFTLKGYLFDIGEASIVLISFGDEKLFFLISLFIYCLNFYFLYFYFL